MVLGLLLFCARAQPGSDTADARTVLVAHRIQHDPYPCEDGHQVRAYLLRNGKLKLNNVVVDQGEFGQRLDDIFRTRAVWLLFFGADPHVSYGAVAETVTEALKHVDYVALVTPSVERSKGCLTVLLPVNFKDHSLVVR